MPKPILFKFWHDDQREHRCSTPEEMREFATNQLRLRNAHKASVEEVRVSDVYPNMHNVHMILKIDKNGVIYDVPRDYGPGGNFDNRGAELNIVRGHRR